ncbi:MAG: Ig-like domain-containing protein [Bacteroidota bacterium]
MNVLLHKLKINLLLLFCFGAVGVSYGQDPSLLIYELSVLKNDTLNFVFQDHHPYNAPKLLRLGNVPNSVSQFEETGNTLGTAEELNTVQYIPPTGFLGRDTIELFYSYPSPSGSGLVFSGNIVLNIAVVPSHITAMPDYVVTEIGQSIEIDVLENDFGSGTNQTIAEVTNRNRGNAVLINNDTKVLFTPSAGYEGLSHFNYSICDAQGACDMTTVSICVVNPNPPAYDSIAVQTKEGQAQVVLMALDTSYSVNLSPDHGVVTDTGDVWTYVPNNGYSGNDKVIFEDAANNRTRVFQIEVIGPAPYESKFLKNDIVSTPVDETIDEIHLLSNDNGGNYLIGVSRINEWGAGDTKEGGNLIYLPSVGKGVYKYIPPAGFTGVDMFRYKGKVPSGNITDTAICYIIVDDLTPELPVYNIAVPENTPLVLGDHIPFLNYEYEIVSPPNSNQGTLTYLPGFNTYASSLGQEFSGYNMLVYEPSSGAQGTDEFEVEYCINGDCQLAKVELNITSIATPQSDTLCSGSSCVWPGDTDKNGKVDINDLLPIGLCMGEVGKVRPSASIDYYAQHAEDWNSLYLNDLDFDIKHVDADGNGIVSSMDTNAISQFYGQYNNLVPLAPAPISELPFYPAPFPGNPQPGDVILLDLNLGNPNLPAFDAYGLTFSVDYDPALFESVKVYWNDDAWMNYNSPILSMSHELFPGKLDAGYTRTSGLAATGHGIIGVLEFIVIDDVIGVRPTEGYSTINISGNLMNSGGQSSDLGSHTMTFSLGLNEDAQEEDLTVKLDDLKIFPNPSKAQVNVHLNGQDNLMERISLYNMVGAQVYDSGTILAKRMQVAVADLNPGVYVMKVQTNGGEMLTSKVEVMR